MTQTAINEEAALRGRLVDLLTDDDAAHRRAAAVVLGALGLGTADALDGLRKTLKDDAPDVRLAAARAIGVIGPKTLVKDLKPLLKDADEAVRAEAKAVLAHGPGVQLEDVAKMLEAKDERQRIGGIAVLGARGGLEARRMLLEQLATGSVKVQEAVLDALGPEVADLAQDDVPSFLHDLDAALDNVDAAGFVGCAGSVVALLSGVEHGAVTGVLSRVVESEAPTAVRVRAVDALRLASRGHRGAQEHVFKTLVAVLEDAGTEQALLVASTDTLGGIDLPIALEPRVRALTKTERTPVRRWAIRALGALDTAPAARALAQVAVDGESKDAGIAIEAAASTVQGRRALAKALGGMKDGERARSIVTLLEPHTKDLTKSILEALEDGVVNAPAEVADQIVKLLADRGVGGNLLEKGESLKAGGEWAEASELFRRLASDSNPEAMFLVGVCELKQSKKHLGRGPSHDPAVEPFRKLTKHPKFPTVERLGKDPDLKPDELYYLGFSLAEDKSDPVRTMGGDILLALSESHAKDPLGKRAEQKLRTMGWID